MNNITFWGDIVARDTNGLRLDDSVAEIIEDSEFNVINFEAPVETKYPPIPKSGPNNTQSRQAPEWCISNGFNVISFANNHSFDFGAEAMTETMEMFPPEYVMGAGTWDEAYKTKIVTLTNGKRIGIIAGTHREFGTLHDEFTQACQKGIAWLFHHRITELILDTKAKVDYLYIYAHGGVEFMEQPLPEWRSAFRHFINLGCDGVICSHPHIPMGWEFYKGKPIVYSLGNFCFQKPGLSEAQLRKNWNNSLCCEISFCGDEPEIQIRPLEYNIESKGIIISNKKDYLNYLSSVNTTLGDNDSYIQKIDELVTNMSPMYLRMLGVDHSKEGLLGKLKTTIKVLLRRKNSSAYIIHSLNAVQCESHRWAIQRIINKKLI